MPEFELDPETTLGKACAALREGKIVCVYDADGREAETDLTVASQFATAEAIRTLRKDGGGLVCTTVDPTTRRLVGMPYMTDVLSAMGDEYPLLRDLVPDDIPYDAKSSFSVYLNHRKTFTGITDKDRALTIKKFDEVGKRIEDINDGEAMKLLGKEFRTPGHVPLCIASKNPLVTRSGHTELVIAILQMANLTPVGTGCEIMGDNGHALSKKEVKYYAENNDYLFLEGKQIIQGWKTWSK